MLKKIVSLIMIITTLFAFVGCEKRYYRVESTVFSGSMVFSATLYGGKEKAAATEMKAFLAQADGIFNVNVAASELSRFNESKANVDVEVSKHLYDVAMAAKEVFVQSNGAFNPALGAISAAWGVDVNGIMRYCYGGEQMSALPTEAELEEMRATTDLSSLELKEAAGKYYLSKTDERLTLDLGGIAKGYCADELNKIARSYDVKSAILAVSGNLMLVGNNAEGKKWSVGVTNPRPEKSPDQYVCGFYESDVSVVTSGDYERFHTFGEGNDSVRICHIIDGRTLLPIGVERTAVGYKNADSFVVSATVIGDSSLLCDAYATAVCVMGVQEGVSFLTERGYKGIIFTSDGKYAVVGEMEMAESATLYLTAYEKV